MGDASKLYTSLEQTKVKTTVCYFCINLPCGCNIRFYVCICGQKLTDMVKDGWLGRSPAWLHVSLCPWGAEQ